MYRTIDCATWGDPWFEELPPPGKLLFLYLISNSRTSASGAYQITLRTMANETCLPPEQVTEMLGAFGNRVVWWPDHACIFVRNFYRYQRANSSDKYRIGAAKQTLDLVEPVRETVWDVYPELRPAEIRTPNPMDRVSAVSVSVSVSETATESKQNKAEKRGQPSVASAPQAAQRAMFGALSESFGRPTPGTEHGKYEAAAKALITAGADPSEIPHLCEAWAWINPGEPRVNSLAGQLTVLRRAQPRASPNVHRLEPLETTKLEATKRAMAEWNAKMDEGENGQAHLQSGNGKVVDRLRPNNDRPAPGYLLGEGEEPPRRVVPGSGRPNH